MREAHDINVFVQADIDTHSANAYSDDLEQIRTAIIELPYVTFCEVMDVDDNKDIGLIDATV